MSGPSGLRLTLSGSGLFGAVGGCHAVCDRPCPGGGTRAVGGLFYTSWRAAKLIHGIGCLLGSDMTARSVATMNRVPNVKCAVRVHAALKAVECCRVKYGQGGKRLIAKRCCLCVPGNR